MRCRKWVLTGGPCAGKSTIAEVLGKSFSDKLVVVPESASTLMRGGFPRWDEESARRAWQHAIFHTQIASEMAYEGHHPGAFLLLDRGTLDGAAYWPEGSASFFKAMGSSAKAELARYDGVIYLESADEVDYERHRCQNPLRTEAWTRARELDRLTHDIWAKHPRFTVVRCQPTFADKVFAVLKLVESQL